MPNTLTDRDYLLQALHLAKQYRGFCAPNPSVASVIVKNNQVIATGYHPYCGGPHAERMALLSLNNNEANGATVYCTLEPCCHTGRTPPCTDLIIATQCTRVVFGMLDPNPQVAKKGMWQLQAAGIEVIHIALPEITDFYESYRYWWQTKTPFITVKLAMSLDGKIAGPGGQRENITGKELADLTGQYRYHSDAILTTAQTILQDNPRLTARFLGKETVKPLVILDRQLRVPKTAQIFQTGAKIFIVHAPHSQIPDVTQKIQTSIAYLPCILSDNKHFDLQAMALLLGEMGFHDVWVESGGQLITALLQAKLVARAFWYVAAKVLGTAATTGWPVAQNILANHLAHRWQLCGNDVICEMRWKSCLQG